MITLSTASHGLTAGQVVRSEADTWPVQSAGHREGRQVETGEREQLTHNGAYFEKYIFIHCHSPWSLKLLNSCRIFMWFMLHAMLRFHQDIEDNIIHFILVKLIMFALNNVCVIICLCLQHEWARECMSPFMGRGRASSVILHNVYNVTWAPHPAQLRYPDIHQYLTTQTLQIHLRFACVSVMGYLYWFAANLVYWKN